MQAALIGLPQCRMDNKERESMRRTRPRMRSLRARCGRRDDSTDIVSSVTSELEHRANVCALNSEENPIVQAKTSAVAYFVLSRAQAH